jgi:hypothetical protein
VWTIFGDEIKVGPELEGVRLAADRSLAHGPADSKKAADDG